MSYWERTRWILLLLVCLFVSAFCVAYPFYVIQPFRAQGARELAVALVVARYGPLLTVVSALVAVGTAIVLWRSQTRRWMRVVAGAGAVFVCVLAALARANVYELMFHPIDHPSFAAARDVNLDKDDKLIVVKIGGSARGYPVRTMGYHHVVNDAVEGTALVATY
jgi:hypothetical protein